MRTTNKQVTEPIREYILNCLTDEPWNFEIEDNTTSKLQYVVDEFCRVANHPYNLKMFPSVQDRFADWLMGLPSCFNVEYRNYKILELMESFGLPLPANKTEKQGIDLFGYLIFREFMQLCKIFGIDTHKMYRQN